MCDEADVCMSCTCLMMMSLSQYIDNNCCACMLYSVHNTHVLFFCAVYFNRSHASLIIHYVHVAQNMTTWIKKVVVILYLKWIINDKMLKLFYPISYILAYGSWGLEVI
jgi:hypothetical protein